jgi:hypothetical protein
MRWLKIREANIHDGLRVDLERMGVALIQQWVVAGKVVRYKKAPSDAPEYAAEREVADWLTEQYDRTERRETWSLTMEVAITVFVLGEFVLSILNWVHKR